MCFMCRLYSYMFGASRDSAVRQVSSFSWGGNTLGDPISEVHWLALMCVAQNVVSLRFPLPTDAPNLWKTELEFFGLGALFATCNEEKFRCAASIWLKVSPNPQLRPCATRGFGADSLRNAEVQHDFLPTPRASIQHRYRDQHGRGCQNQWDPILGLLG